MGFTAIVMSKDEAMTLPVEKRPLCFRLPEELYLAIFEAVGAASMQWDPVPSGIFKSDAAARVATDLCFKVAEYLERQNAKLSRTPDGAS